MSFQQETTASNTPELAALRSENQVLNHRVITLEAQLDWFKQQLFGQKSEKRTNIDGTIQLNLLSDLAQAPSEPPPAKETITYERQKRNKTRDGAVTASGLRFDATVPVKEIILTAPELEGPDAEDYEVIMHKELFRLAQRQASYVVLKYLQPVVKHKRKETVRTIVPDTTLFDGSCADVSFIAGMLIDKFLYHQPLYRQHLKLNQSGITLSRTTLTNLCAKGIELLRPIYDAQWHSIVDSATLIMDETSVKAGKQRPGKMETGWFWPVWGDKGEACFPFASSRGTKVVENLLAGFNGTLVTDGYKVYERYVKSRPHITHAQCWVHARRYVLKAEKSEPDLTQHWLDQVKLLYAHEDKIKEQGLSGEAKRCYRQQHSKPIVDKLFSWSWSQRSRVDILPDDPFAKAMFYMTEREDALRVFLDDPEVPLDTNEIERQLRVIPMGKRNWLFCWTELGAEHVGIIQSLITTCRAQGICPYTYLVDVLLRVGRHPASKVHELTPRLWKILFADNPLTSDLLKD